MVLDGSTMFGPAGCPIGCKYPPDTPNASLISLKDAPAGNSNKRSPNLTVAWAITVGCLEKRREEKRREEKRREEKKERKWELCKYERLKLHNEQIDLPKKNYKEIDKSEWSTFFKRETQ